MNTFIETLNLWGREALRFAWPMLWQSSLLMVLLFALDYTLRRKVRAAVRYALWCLVLVKLLLPPSLALPTSVAWWLRHSAPALAIAPAQQKPPATVVVTYPDIGVPTLALPRTIPTAVRPAPSSTPISGAATALGVWSLISLGLLLWLGVRWRHVTKLHRSSVPAPLHEERSGLNELFESAKGLAGVRQPVPCRLIERPMSPAVCGLFRPVILLPRLLTDQLPAEQLRTILLHELIHLRRRDVWVNCLQSLLQILYWWHPLLWLANARIRRLREEAVDDAVMLALADQADAYAPTLLEVAKLAFYRPLTALGLVGILESRRGLRQRIERLMNFKTPRRAGLSVVSLLCIAAFTALAMPMGEAPPKAPAPALPSDPAVYPSAGKVQTVATNSDGPATDAAQFLVMAASIDTDAGRGLTVFSNEVVIVNNKYHWFGLAESAEISVRPGELRANHVRWMMTTNNIHTTVDKMTMPIEPDSLQIELLSRGPGDLEYTNAVYQKVIGELKRLRSSPASNGEIILSGRQRIIGELASIRLDEIKFDHLPLSEAVHILQDEVKKRDADGRGVNFIINPSTTVNPTAGLISTNPSADDFDLSSVPITFTIHDIRAIDVVDAIVAGAEHPIKYSLVDYGVIFSKKGNEPTLFIRRFKTDPVAFAKAFEEFDPGAADFLSLTHKPAGSATNTPVVVPRLSLTNGIALVSNDVVTSPMIRFFASIVGVDLDPAQGKGVFYHDRSGDLLVRGTAEDLDRIEKYLVRLNSPGLAKPSEPPAAGTSQVGNAVEVGQHVQNGKLLYELGKWDRAEAELRQALALEPQNKAAQYYLALVQDARQRPKPGQPTVQSTPNQGTNLYIRKFKVDPNTFYLSLEDAGVLSASNLVAHPSGNAMNEVAIAVREFFSNFGVNLDPPKSVFFNDREGSLLVRATQQDLDYIESVVETLNAPTPQVTVKVKFVEITQTNGSLGFDWYLGNFVMNHATAAKGTAPAKTPASSAPTGVFPGAAPPTADASAPGSSQNPPAGQSTGILTDPQYRVVLQALQKNDKVNLLSDGQVTTLSGRQAQLQVVEMKTIVTNINPQALKAPGIPSSRLDDALLSTKLPCGPILDVIPTVGADGYTIHLNVTATLTEFLGYEDGGKNNQVTVYLRDKKAQTKLPIPKIRTRQLSTEVIVWDGQTVVLGGLIADGTPGPNGAITDAGSKKNLMVFITPFITDPAGNRVHLDEDRPNVVKTAVPSQSR